MSSKSEIQKQKRSKLIHVLDAYLEAKGEDYITAYFSANEKYRVQLKVVDEQLQAFLDDENIRQIGDIEYEVVENSLTNTDHKNNLRYNRHFLQQAIENRTGIDLNPLCCGYFGPHKNPTRGTHRYNAYASLYFKSSDLEELLIKNDLSFPKEFISINELLELCWELLKDDALVVEVNPKPSKTRKLDKEAVLEKKQLRTGLLQKLLGHFNANGQSDVATYFFADKNYPLDLKMVGSQPQAFLNEHNIRQINEIHYEEIKQVLANDEHKNNLESNRLLIQHAIQNNASVALNPLCAGYLGPHRNPTRRTHSYNAYDKLYFLTNDLSTFLTKNNLSFLKAFVSINELLTLCWTLLKEENLLVDVNAKTKKLKKKKVKKINKEAALEKRQLRNRLIEYLGVFLGVTKRNYLTAYFLADENYQVDLKVVGNQLWAFLSNQNIRQIDEIHYEQIKQVLVGQDHKNNLENNRLLIQKAIKNNTGIALNPLCGGYLGPHNSPDRSTHRYNAYDSLYFKTSDLEELLTKNNLSFSKAFVSINDLLELCWELLKDDALVVEVNSKKVEMTPSPVATPKTEVLPEANKTDPEVSALELAVNEALECLDYADLAGYFVAIDAVVPSRSLAIYNQVKQQYILNGSSGEYLERLKVFAHSLLMK